MTRSYLVCLHGRTDLWLKEETLYSISRDCIEGKFANVVFLYALESKTKLLDCGVVTKRSCILSGKHTSFTESVLLVLVLFDIFRV